MLRYSVTQNVDLFCSLSQKNSDRFIKAFIFKQDGTHALGGDGSTPLYHVENGLYKSAIVLNLAIGIYKILYIPFLDSIFSVADTTYGTKEETLEMYESTALDISTISNKIDSLIAAVNVGDISIEVEDDDTVIEVSVTEDDSYINIEIGE